MTLACKPVELSACCDSGAATSAIFREAKVLCSGIKRTPHPITKSNASEKKLGSWHQCYRLDGKLIAVAVLDLVPSGVSSVYIL